MTQQEFEQLYGKKVSNTEYEVINAMYMRYPNETKQDFVARYKNMGKGELMDEFAAIIHLSDAQEDALIKEKNNAIARAMEAERRAAKLEAESNSVVTEKVELKVKLAKAVAALTETAQKLHDFAAITAVELHTSDKTATIAACIETLGMAGYCRALLNAGCNATTEEIKLFIDKLEAIENK